MPNSEAKKRANQKYYEKNREALCALARIKYRENAEERKKKRMEYYYKQKALKSQVNAKI